MKERWKERGGGGTLFYNVSNLLQHRIQYKTMSCKYVTCLVMFITDALTYYLHIQTQNGKRFINFTQLLYCQVLKTTVVYALLLPVLPAVHKTQIYQLLSHTGHTEVVKYIL